jgi:hypothetical protein
MIRVDNYNCSELYLSLNYGFSIAGSRHDIAENVAELVTGTRG